MIYFCVSDIHGHYDSLITALNEAGFNKDLPQHHLIVIGDLFDRGNQSNKVLDYLYELSNNEKTTIVLGNHDTFLLELFESNYMRVRFNILKNGFLNTLKSLSMIDNFNPDFDEEIDMVRNSILEKYPFIEKWIRSFPLYLELGDYIFVHGGIDGSKNNWKESPIRDFIWGRMSQLNRVPNKTVVVGHQRIPTIKHKTKDYKQLFKDNPEYFDILYEEGKIFIDRYVEITNELNVLKLEIELD